MLRININQVPSFLRDSELYNNITVDKQYYIDQLNIKTFDDFTQALKVLNHWKVKDLPFAVFDFIKNNKTYLGRDKFEMVNDRKKKKNNPKYKCRYLRFFDTLTDLSETSREELYIVYNWRVSAEYFASRNVHFMSECARLGCLNLMKYGYLHQMSWDFSVVEMAIKEDNFECFKYAVDNGCKTYDQWSPLMTISVDTVAICEFNRLKYLQYADSTNKLYNATYRFLFDYALDKNNLECLEWSFSKLSDKEREILKGCKAPVLKAVDKGYEQILTFLVNNNFPIPFNACPKAFNEGNYVALKMLYQHGGKWDLMDDVTNKEDMLKCLEFAYDMLNQSNS